MRSANGGRGESSRNSFWYLGGLVAVGVGGGYGVGRVVVAIGFGRTIGKGFGKRAAHGVVGYLRAAAVGIRHLF